MSSSARPKPSRIEKSFPRGIVTSILLVMLAVMIVRDILVRRWGSEKQPQSDVTQRAR